MKKPKYDQTRLPLYDIEVNDDDMTGIQFISIVAKPAIEIKGVAFNEDEEEEFEDADCSDLHEHNFDAICDSPPCHPHCVCYIDEKTGYWKNQPYLTKSGVCALCVANRKRYNKKLYGKRVNENMRFAIKEDQQILAGPTMIPYKNIYRSDESGEYMVRFTPDTIKKIVQKFFKNNNNWSINVEHTNQMVQGYITEHWIVEDTMYDKSKLYGFNLPVGSHFMLVKIEDNEFWKNQIKGENKTGFSIEGILGQSLVAMTKLASDKISFDYHGVLNTEEGKKKAKEMIDNGYDVHIVTNASEAESGRAIKKVADELGIPESKIHYAKGDKPGTLDRLGIKIHYDNNPNIVKDVNKESDTTAKKFMDEIIDSLTEIELAEILTFVEPGKKETEDEFIGRCIPYVINDGTAKDNSQAYAICKSKWDNK